mgnify:CR=1 FL=1
MNKNEKMSFLKGKGAAIGIVVCFMAVLAVVGTYTVGNYKKDMKEQMAKAEKEAEQFTEDNTKEIQMKSSCRKWKKRMKMNKKAGKMCLIQQGRKKEFSRREAPRQIFGFQKKAFLHGLQAEQ